LPRFSQTEIELFHKQIIENDIFIVLSDELFYEITNSKNKVLLQKVFDFLKPIEKNLLIIKSFDEIKEIELIGLLKDIEVRRFDDFYYSVDSFNLNKFSFYSDKKKINEYKNKVLDNSLRISGKVLKEDEITDSKINKLNIHEILNKKDFPEITDKMIEDINKRNALLGNNQSETKESIENTMKNGKELTEAILNKDLDKTIEVLSKIMKSLNDLPIFDEISKLMKSMNINFNINDIDLTQNIDFLKKNVEQSSFLVENATTFKDFKINNEFNLYATKEFKNNLELMNKYTKVAKKEQFDELPGISIHRFLSKRLEHKIKTNPINTKSNDDTRISTQNESDFIHASVIPYVNLFYCDKRVFSELNSQTKERIIELNWNGKNGIAGNNVYIAKTSGNDIYEQLMSDLIKCSELQKSKKEKPIKNWSFDNKRERRN